MSQLYSHFSCFEKVSNPATKLTTTLTDPISKPILVDTMAPQRHSSNDRRTLQRYSSDERRKGLRHQLSGDTGEGPSSFQRHPSRPIMGTLKKHSVRKATNAFDHISTQSVQDLLEATTSSIAQVQPKTDLTTIYIKRKWEDFVQQARRR